MDTVEEETAPLLGNKDIASSKKHYGCFTNDPRPKCIEFAAFWYFLAHTGSVSLVEQFVHSQIDTKYNKVWSLLDYLNIHLRNNTKEQLEAAESCDVTENNYTSPFSSVIEASVQEESSTWLLYFDLALTLPAIFSTLIICTASDKYGRKIGIVLVSGASSLRLFMFLLAIYQELNPAVYLLANAVEGLSGSSLTMFGSCLAYIVDTSSVSNRSLRFVLLQSVQTLASALSSVSVGFLITGLGYTTTFWIIASVHCINTIHIAIAVPDSHQNEGMEEPVRVPVQRRRSSLQALKEGTITATKKLLGSFSVFSQDYQNYSKVRLLLLLTAFLTQSIILLGSSSVVTLYMLSTPFCWNSVLIGIYHAIYYVITGAVGMICVWILRKLFKDVTMALIGSISLILNRIVFGLAVNSFMLYLAILAGMGANMSFPLIRSMMSKIVGADRQGALFAAIFCLETVCDLVSGVLMNAIYSATVAIYPGIVFFISAAVLLISALFLCLSFFVETRVAMKTEGAQSNSTTP